MTIACKPFGEQKANHALDYKGKDKKDASYYRRSITATWKNKKWEMERWRLVASGVVCHVTQRET